MLFEGPFWGLIYGAMFAFLKWLGQLIAGRKFMFYCTVFAFWGQFPSISPLGLLFGGFFCVTSFRSLYLQGFVFGILRWSVVFLFSPLSSLAHSSRNSNERPMRACHCRLSVFCLIQAWTVSVTGKQFAYKVRLAFNWYGFVSEKLVQDS